MDRIEKDFQNIFNVVTGNTAKEEQFAWVENAFATDSDFAGGYKDLWRARENLCRRFGLAWEDADLELFMNGVLKLEQDLARRMFRCGVAYAEKRWK